MNIKNRLEKLEATVKHQRRKWVSIIQETNESLEDCLNRYGYENREDLNFFVRQIIDSNVSSKSNH
jgi:hypothetical protein